MDSACFPQGPRATGPQARSSSDGAAAVLVPPLPAAVNEQYYGPCTACRTELRATLGGESHAVEAAGYEPKMNVTPNAVALKDD